MLRRLFSLLLCSLILFLALLFPAGTSLAAVRRRSRGRHVSAYRHPARRRSRRFVVAVDAGHGGRDPGALSRGRGLAEKRVTLDVALRVARYLKRRGCEVRLSRRSDRTLPPPRRARWIRRTPSDALVSIHCDSLPRRRTLDGASTYYQPHSRQGLALARCIQHRLVLAAHTRSLGVRSDTIRGRRGFYVLRGSHRPAALVEVGYLSHPAAARRLRRPAYRSRLARGIGTGVLTYLKRYRRRC